MFSKKTICLLVLALAALAVPSAWHGVAIQDVPALKADGGLPPAPPIPVPTVA